MSTDNTANEKPIYPIKLSIVIISYNVSFYLRNCLLSVYKAIQNINTEIFVVDNNSSDDSVEMVLNKFHNVKLIRNNKNVGFSTANNQAIRLAKGEYVLLLNPDTIVKEGTFDYVLEFMNEHKNAGAIGVKMLDGNGCFLPESKRGLPSPKVAFYKLIGLSKLFPSSIRFARYYLGHLSENETHKVDVLAGAFMFIRGSLLDKIGLLDESFFMYGEDIDLSYRITRAGYNNYYLPTPITHFKGRSSSKNEKQSSIAFYQSMLVFYDKHLVHHDSKLGAFLIRKVIHAFIFLSKMKRIFI